MSRKARRNISVTDSDWEAWQRIAKVVNSSVSEVLAESMRHYMGNADQEDAVQQCLKEGIEEASAALRNVITVLDGIVGKVDELNDKNEQPSTRTTPKYVEKMDKYDRLFADIQAGKFSRYCSQEIYDEYDIDAHASGNIWHRATKDIPELR